MLAEGEHGLWLTQGYRAGYGAEEPDLQRGGDERFEISRSPGNENCFARMLAERPGSHKCHSCRRNSCRPARLGAPAATILYCYGALFRPSDSQIDRTAKP